MAGEGFLYASTGGDYMVQVDVDQNTGAYGDIWVRRLDRNNGYRVRVLEDGVELHKLEDRNLSSLASGSFTEHDTVAVKIKLEGSSIKVWIDGTEEIDTTDSTFTAGGVSLAGDQTVFTDLKIGYDNNSDDDINDAGESIFRGAAIADVDGDGGLDVAFGSNDGILWVLRGGDGEVIWTYDLQDHYGKTFEMDHAPVIADFDGDGDLDIFIVGGYTDPSDSTLNHGRAYAVTGGAGSGPGWPMFRHDVHHSGCYTVEEEPIPAVSEWGLVAMVLIGLTAGTLLFRRSSRHML